MSLEFTPVGSDGPFDTRPLLMVGTGFGDNTALKTYIEALLAEEKIVDNGGVMRPGVVIQFDHDFIDVAHLSPAEFKALCQENGTNLDEPPVIPKFDDPPVFDDLMPPKSAKLLASLVAVRAKRAVPAAASVAEAVTDAAVGAASKRRVTRSRASSAAAADASDVSADEMLVSIPSAVVTKKPRSAGVRAHDGSLDFPEASATFDELANEATKKKVAVAKPKKTTKAKSVLDPASLPPFPPSSLSVSRPSPPPRAPAPLGPGYFVGAHVSAMGGVDKSPANAAAIGCSVFALDLRNKRRWVSPPLTDETVRVFKQEMARFNYPMRAVVPHGSYLMNLASPDASVVEKSREALLDEMQRCARLGIVLYNFHPGSTVGQGTLEDGVKKIAEGINWVHEQTKGDETICVLENTAGGGSSLGTTFEELAAIITLVSDRSRVGVCLDTCHLLAAGYDLASPGGVKRVLQRFDEVVGMGYLRAMHVNDSKAERGSRRDRHEHIGYGFVGLEAFKELMTLPELRGIPLVLETPVERRSERDEIAFVAALARQEAKTREPVVEGDEANIVE